MVEAYCITDQKVDLLDLDTCNPKVMTDSKQISILSELPVETLDHLRLALNIAYAETPMDVENAQSFATLH